MTRAVSSNRIEEIRLAFRDQGRACRDLGSPFMGQLCDLLADRIDPFHRIGRRIFEWDGNVTATGDAVALRLCGGLHFLVLSGLEADLSVIYGKLPDRYPDDETLWSAVNTVLDQEADQLLSFMDSPPQTNEVRRSSALLAGWQMVANRWRLPLNILELGSSAGLNLFADQYELLAGDHRIGQTGSPVLFQPQWRGGQPKSLLGNSEAIDVKSRRGCDLRPVSLFDREQEKRLLAYLWPDQKDRLDRTRQAIRIAKKHPFVVQAAGAETFLENELSDLPAGGVTIVQHTIAWQYFPEDVKQLGSQLIGDAGKMAGKDSPLVRLSMEADGKERGAALTMTTWPDGREELLARVDFHGRWIDWLID